MCKQTGAAEKLGALRARGMKFGTQTTRALLDGLGSPDGALKIVHIAGTNGKGSVAEFVTQILLAAGKRVGTFTSPEVYGYNEMFRVDGKPLSDEVLSGYISGATAVAEGTEATSFEVETAAALYAFFREGCEYAVLECGMGGKDDATNAVRRKEVAIITSVSLEHTAYLGRTVREICEKKAGIVKNCPLIVHPSQSEEGMAFLRAVAGAIVAKEPCRAADNAFFYEGKRFEIRAIGGQQPANAACAIEAARVLKIDESAIYEGVKRALPAGRLQLFRKAGRLYLLDGAHNPAAFVPLASLLQEGNLPEEKTVVFGCLSDKDIDGCLAAIAGCARRVVAVTPPSPRAMEKVKMLAACRKFFPEVGEAASVSAALDGADSSLVVVCGSFTILKEAKQWIEQK